MVSLGVFFIPAACHYFCELCLPKSAWKCHQLNLVTLTIGRWKEVENLSTKEMFLQVNRQIHKHLHVCTHQIISHPTFLPFKALKGTCVNRNSEIPGNAKYLFAPSCPSRWLSHQLYKCKAYYRICGRWLHFRFLSHNTPTKAVLGHPPNLRSGK